MYSDWLLICVSRTESSGPKIIHSVNPMNKNSKYLDSIILLVHVPTLAVTENFRNAVPEKSNQSLN